MTADATIAALARAWRDACVAHRRAQDRRDAYEPVAADPRVGDDASACLALDAAVAAASLREAETKLALFVALVERD